MKQKTILILILLFLIGTFFFPVRCQTRLILNFNNGTQKSSELNSLKKITFQDSNIVLNYASATNDSYSLSSIRNMIFGSLSEVSELLADNSSLAIYPNPASDYIMLKNTPSEVFRVVIYQLDGSVVYTCQLSSSTEKIDISALSKGLYIIKVNNKALKFTKL